MQAQIVIDVVVAGAVIEVDVPAVDRTASGCCASVVGSTLSSKRQVRVDRHKLVHFLDAREPVASRPQE